MTQTTHEPANETLFRCGRRTRSGASCKNYVEPWFNPAISSDGALMGHIPALTGRRPCKAHRSALDSQIETKEQILAEVIAATRASVIKEMQREDSGWLRIGAA